MSTVSKTVIPRNFLLLEALNKDGNYSLVSYGLMDESEYKNNYVTMEYWNGSMTYDDGENFNIFELLIQCTMKYPEERPIVTFRGQSLENHRLKKLCDEKGHLLESVMKHVKYDESMLLGDYLTNLLTLIKTYRIY